MSAQYKMKLLKLEEKAKNKKKEDLKNLMQNKPMVNKSSILMAKSKVNTKIQDRF
jgi:hypothetical protein